MLDVSKMLEQKIKKVDFLVFDLDGTLIHTNFLAYKSAIEQIVEPKLNLTYNSNRRITRKVVRNIIPNLKEEKYKKIIKLKEKIFVNYLCETKLNDRIINILFEYLTTKNSILVTKSRKERAILLLKYHKIINCFSHRFYRQKSNFNKFQYSLNALQISANSVIVFENEDQEINAAILAGIPDGNIIKSI